MNTCSVIIVNYNTGKILAPVVKAIIGNVVVKDIIIVDNFSQDNSMDSIPENVKIKKYFRQKNHGFANSCNFGRSKTETDFVLFLNPDCIVSKETVEVLLENFNSDRRIAIVGCRVNNPDGTEQRASRRRAPTFWRALKTFCGLEKLAKLCQCFAGVNLNQVEMPRSWQYVEAISGALILMKTHVFDEINGFDEKFPMHFEDLDLFKRTRDKGYKIVFNPKVSAIHHQGTSSQTNPRVVLMKKQGLQRYFSKHCSKLSYLLVKLLR